MRKVVVYELLSLDGVAEQPDDFIADFDDVMRENLERDLVGELRLVVAPPCTCTAESSSTRECRSG